MWLMKKQELERAKLDLMTIEQKMMPLLKQTEEGSRTTTTPAGNKVTLRCGYNYTFDGTTLNRIRKSIPPALLPLKTKEVLDEPRLRELRSNEPDTYRILATAIRKRPAKPYIKIEAAADV
tara:strand:- start:95 stop:457 length:363 start_codon:yes stop_codon:yes gene_type:complete